MKSYKELDPLTVPSTRGRATCDESELPSLTFLVSQQDMNPAGNGVGGEQVGAAAEARLEGKIAA